jgi:murein DD-endopeptidase MepM/ murein hydrolase activator NlpD
MKTKKTIYEWLTTNFAIHMQNEDDFSLKRSFRLNYAKILVFLSAFVLIIAFFSVTLFKWVDSYYSDELRKEKAFRKEIYKLRLAIDSLETQSVRSDSFVQSFKTMLSGTNELLENERLRNRAETKNNILKREDQMLPAEVQMRKEFESTKEVQNSTNLSEKELGTTKKQTLSGIYFFPPISGLISNHFDSQSKHFGIDILSKENEPIKSVSDGSVIYSGWSYDTGYMLVVQHDEDLISVYKHNASLLKKVGENVKSGEVVAIIGNSGELTTGPHLHFELWFKGRPLNPLDYIVF